MPANHRQRGSELPCYAGIRHTHRHRPTLIFHMSAGAVLNHVAAVDVDGSDAVRIDVDRIPACGIDRAAHLDVDKAAGRKLPVVSLEKFVRDTKHHPRARYLAYELIARVDAARTSRLIDGFRDDPSPDLRRVTVQQLMDLGVMHSKSGRTNEAVAQYQTIGTPVAWTSVAFLIGLALLPLGYETKGKDLPA